MGSVLTAESEDHQFWLWTGNLAPHSSVSFGLHHGPEAVASVTSVLLVRNLKPEHCDKKLELSNPFHSGFEKKGRGAESLIMTSQVKLLKEGCSSK